MFRNYIKVALRNFSRNKIYSFINITGLATGMAVVILIGLWIWDEVSFDRSFSNYKRLGQVMVTQSLKGESYTDQSIAMPLGNALRTQYNDDIKNTSLTSWNNDHTLASGDKILTGSGMWVQPEFTEMFSLNMLQGNRNALSNLSSVLIARSLAKALFGSDNPVNKVIRLDYNQDLYVAGVYEDFPFNSTFYNVRVLLPWDNKQNWLNSQTSWSNHCGQLFVQLNDKADFNKTTAKVKNLPTPHIKDWNEEILVHPMEKMHLYNQFENGKIAGGRIQFVWLYGIIGAFVLLLACINFMNLSTARSEKRAREVGIRKAAGSLRRQLIGQFLGESLLMALFAFGLSYVLVYVSLPWFNTLADKKIVLPNNNPVFWLLTAGFVLFTGLVAGSYPAFYLSGFQPVKILKGTFRAGRLASVPRKVLVVLQFSVSVMLIIGTVIVFQQVQYTKNRPAGYSRDGLITIPLLPGFYGKYEALRNDMLQTGMVTDMAESSFSTTGFQNSNGLDWEGRDPHKIVFFRDVNVSYDFGNTIGWKIKEGRDFSRSFATDSSAVILNEAAIQAMGFKNPIGKTVTRNDKRYTIIGVVNDMLTNSPYEPIQPGVFFLGDWMGVITARIKPGAPVRDALTRVENIFKKYNPGSPFDYRFTDEEYNRKFSNETRIGNLAAVFTILAIFISCLGLFGLASFVAEQRNREIGVRKVLGASVFSIWKLLSKEFVALIIVSQLIAVPVAYYFMHNWLQDYQYRTSIGWWIIAASCIGALVIAILTVSFQSIKAAISNPVKSLRSE